MSIYKTIGVTPIINAKGPATRLSGGLMRPEVAEAMAQASQHCVDMAELQAAASQQIAGATGAEAGYVASGASACLLLAAAACMAGLDPGRMARLPDTRGMKNEIIMIRSQRNFYDHAIRAAGATIIEVGLPDRYSGAGVRDAEGWEIEDAISERTAAMVFVATAETTDTLPGVLEVQSYGERLRVLVDDPALRRPQLNAVLAAAGIAHDELRETPVHMEEAFIHLVQEQRHLLGEDHPHAQVLKESAA